VDIGGLVGTSFTGTQSQISGGLELKLGLASRLLEADVKLTKIGSKMLDRALLYLDPDGRNAGISDIRQQLNDYAISPRLVSARIKHGNLRLDIKMKKEGIGLGRIAADNIEKISRNSLRRFPLGILMDRIFPALDTLLGRPAAQAP